MDNKIVGVFSGAYFVSWYSTIARMRFKSAKLELKRKIASVPVFQWLMP